MKTIIFAVILTVLGIQIGYNIAMCKIYGWMTDILKPMKVSLDNIEFLHGIMFAQNELDKKIRRVKENKEDEED